MDVQVVGLRGVESLLAAGEQQARALAAELGADCLPDSAAGAGHEGRDLLECHVRALLGG
jgi:hypothetical protein